MEYRNLGRAGVKVSPLWLGTAYFNTRISEEDGTALIHAALEAGINVIDTANAYSEPRGYSEEIVGRAISDHRDQVVLATKVFHPMGDGPNDRGTSRYHIMEQVHASLRRLNTDRIDLYQLHRPDPDVPIEETLRTLEDLRRQGKILYFGTSKFAGWQLCEALWTSDRLGLAPIVSEQPQYNILDRSIEAEVLPVTRKYGLGVVPYSPWRAAGSRANTAAMKLLLPIRDSRTAAWILAPQVMRRTSMRSKPWKQWPPREASH